MLVDAHCHLTFKDFDKDLDQVIKRFKSLGGGAIICNGSDPESNKATLELAKKYKIVKAALGLYPSDALKTNVKKALNFIQENKSKIIAIGEVGIDFFHIKDAKEQARECEIFKQVIKLANSINKPLIVHSRAAKSKVLELLEAAKVPVVLHFYCGKAEDTKIAIERGYYFSIPTLIVKSKTFKKLAKRVPLDRILTETDAGALRWEGGRNEPANVRFSIKKLAEVKGVSAKEVEAQIWKNYKRIFK
tara:strand:+ start:425 stop:1165 length:741 start_codon:yes stop_codon:yes gene_type:complete